MVTTAMDMDTALTDTAMLLLTPTDIMVTTARGPLMLSPDMATTATDTDTATDTATDTTEDTEDTTTERGPLMLSPDMATTAMDTEDTAEDTTVMVMVMATDTTVEKFQKFMLIHQIRVQYK